MFLLFGTKGSSVIVAIVSFVCGICGVLADQQVIKQSTKLTLFFLPLFSLRSSFVNECTHCGGVTTLTAEQVEHSLDWARTHASS